MPYLFPTKPRENQIGRHKVGTTREAKMVYRKSTIERIADFIKGMGSSEKAEAKRVAQYDLNMQFYKKGHSSAPYNPVAAQQKHLETAFRKPSREHFETYLANKTDHTPRKTKTVFVSGSSLKIAA